MDLIDAIRSHVMALPDLAKFAVVVAAIVGVPRLAARIRLPPMVGLLLFGVALGPHVLGFFGEHRPIANFFGELGKLLLMFSVGLEIDIGLFRRAQARSIIMPCCSDGRPKYDSGASSLSIRFLPKSAPPIIGRLVNYSSKMHAVSSDPAKVYNPDLSLPALTKAAENVFTEWALTFLRDIADQSAEIMALSPKERKEFKFGKERAEALLALRDFRVSSPITRTSSRRRM
jgi:Sodium/hydrogen exchanger family